MAWDSGLEGTARQIAATGESPLRVMAGPGTGKSFAMKRRITRLLEEGCSPEKILAVTFTRNAAASLVDDLNNLGVDGCNDVCVGTLHALCFSIIVNEEVFEFLDRHPRPLITYRDYGVLRFEASALLDDLKHTGLFGGKRDCTKKILEFEAAWAKLQSDVPGWPSTAIDRNFNGVLLSWLQFHESMLIGEVVPEALRYLRNNPESEYLNRFEHVIVDEYQDLNRAEQELIDVLSARGKLAIVGDVDQSIYRFRHANPEGITDFHEHHGGTHDETLDLCRRCPTRVVSIADNLICNNHTGDAVCRLRPMDGRPEGHVKIVQWAHVGQETEGMANFVRHLVNTVGILPQDILILTPRRLLAYALRDRINQHGISVHSFYQEEALEEAEAQEGFAKLTLLANPNDRVALRWWLGREHASGRAAEYSRLREYCESNGVPPRDALDSFLAGQQTIPRIDGLVAQYRILQEQLSRIQGLTLPEIIDAVFPDDTPGCRELRDLAILKLNVAESIQQLFDYIKLNVVHPEAPSEFNYVRIMSLHKSKGLTSRAVIVTGCSHGLIPTLLKDATQDENAANFREQRRLFYVALTRCTEYLVLSSAARMDIAYASKLRAKFRPIGGTRNGAITSSPYLAELGPNAPTSVRGSEWEAAGYT